MEIQKRDKVIEYMNGEQTVVYDMIYGPAKNEITPAILRRLLA